MGSAQNTMWSEDDACEHITCDWHCLSAQLLSQWKKLTQEELEYTGHNRQAIAELIERKHGIDAQLVEHYLQNVERTLPLYN